jgi:glycine/D-amino acid oxidase-like deaminating enzyme
MGEAERVTITTDVVVIGAGIAGASCAFHLGGLGVKTALVEKQHPAAGPSGGSSAICHAFYLDPALTRLGARGTKLLRRIPELTGGPDCFRAVGMLWVVGDKAAPGWAAAAARVRGGGATIETLMPEEVGRMAPGFDLDGVALGVWTKPLVAALGVELPIHVERHGMAVPDAPGGAHSMLPFAWCDDLLCSYARPEGENTVLVGSRAGGGTGLRNQTLERPSRVSDPDGDDEIVDAEESAEILAYITPRIAAFAALGIRKGDAGLYDMRPDDNPIIDRLPDLEGAFVICGSSGHGFKLGPAVGEEVARLVTTGRSDLLEPFGIGRFRH